MITDEIRYRLEALRWYPVHIGFLKEKIATYERQIQIRKRHQQDYAIDGIKQMMDFTGDNLKRTMLAQETVLRFVKQYANEDDYELLMMHFHEGKTYMQMADELFYCERTIINKVNQAIKTMMEKAKDVEAFPY